MLFHLHYGISHQKYAGPRNIGKNEIAAIHWQDEQHVILVDRGGTDTRPHFYHLAQEGAWDRTL